MVFEDATCALCGVRKCMVLIRDPNSSLQVPKNCPMEKKGDYISESIKLGWQGDPELKKINLVEEQILHEGSDPKYGPSWCRIKEVMEYAKRIGYKKLGLAFCVGVWNEAKTLHQVLKAYGFEVVSVSCFAGIARRSNLGLTPKELSTIRPGGAVCNPTMQAEVLNQANTDLNLMLCLCIGHDILFQRYSNVDTTVIGVKDKVTGHNPLAALYLSGLYFRKRLAPDKKNT